MWFQYSFLKNQQVSFRRNIEFLNNAINSLDVMGDIYGTCYSAFKNAHSSTAHMEVLWKLTTYQGTNIKK